MLAEAAAGAAVCQPPLVSRLRTTFYKFVTSSLECFSRNFGQSSCVKHTGMSGTNEMLADDANREAGLILSAPRRGPLEARLEQLKAKLLKPLIATTGNSDLTRELSWAANEAAALAWFSICPFLVLPTLLEEKVCAASKRWEKQQHLWQSDRSKQAA